MADTTTRGSTAMSRVARQLLHSFFTRAARRMEHPLHRPGIRFTVRTEYDELDKMWIVECLELPGCMSQGETEREALDNLMDAICGVLSARIEQIEEEDHAVASYSHRIHRRSDSTHHGRTVAIGV